MKIEVLGHEYIKAPVSPKPKSLILAKKMAMMAPMMMPGFKKPRQRPRVDIVKEFELIQLKKSKLSRSDREWVVSVFNRNFIKV